MQELPQDVFLHVKNLGEGRQMDTSKAPAKEPSRVERVSRCKYPLLHELENHLFDMEEISKGFCSSFCLQVCLMHGKSGGMGRRVFAPLRSDVFKIFGKYSLVREPKWAQGWMNRVACALLQCEEHLGNMKKLRWCKMLGFWFVEGCSDNHLASETAPVA